MTPTEPNAGRDELLAKLRPTLDCNCRKSPDFTDDYSGCRQVGCSAAQLSAYTRLRAAASAGADEVQSLTERVRALEAAVDRLTWTWETGPMACGDMVCRGCGRPQHSSYGHATDCWIAALRSGAPGQEGAE